MDFDLCDTHKTQIESGCREVYLDLGAVGCNSCTENYHPLRFETIYQRRARKWLNESTLTTRKEALDAACEKLGVVPHHSSKLVPAFHKDTHGDKSATEIASILEGVKRCFSVSHKAFSQLHETLHVQLRRQKFQKRITWAESVDLWEERHLDNFVAEYDSNDGYDRYDRYDRYGHHNQWDRLIYGNHW
jgi:hypothetical protein